MHLSPAKNHAFLSNIFSICLNCHLVDIQCGRFAWECTEQHTFGRKSIKTWIKSLKDWASFSKKTTILFSILKKRRALFHWTNVFLKHCELWIKCVILLKTISEVNLNFFMEQHERLLSDVLKIYWMIKRCNGKIKKH